MSRAILLSLLLCLIAAGCGLSDGQTPAAPAYAAAKPQESSTPIAMPTLTAAVTPTVTVEPTTEVTASAAITSTVPPGMYLNPVYDRDFPYPDVLQVGDTYYAYATNSNATSSNDIHVQAARSEDLVRWEPLPDALPRLPPWAVQDFGWTWAPEVFRPTPDGPYVMYYTTRLAIGAGGIQCIGLATAEIPEGPFEPQGDEPVVCQQDQGGSIDPATFRDDDGSLYLLWKNDGNSRGGQTWLYIQPLAADGLSLTGEPARLLTVDKIWEGVLVEAPTLWKHKGKYYLFYSANDYSSPRYTTGYAVADNLLGPYTKNPDPLLKTNAGAGIVGPGGQDVVTGPRGDNWIVLHGWAPGAYRRLYLARLDWQDGAPVVKGLGRDPQPAP